MNYLKHGLPYCGFGGGITVLELLCFSTYFIILFKSSDSFDMSILADAYKSITGSKFFKFGLYFIKLIGLSDS